MQLADASKVSACHSPGSAFPYRTIDRMAGRPRKHFENPVHLGFQVNPALAKAFRDGAALHGLTNIDYLAALVAAEQQRPDLGPSLQEVLPPTG